MHFSAIGRNVVSRLFQRLPREWKVILQNARTLAVRYGQLDTARTFKATDADGQAIPWYTYPAIEYLTRFDLGTRRVFEYGSGQSTIFWARRAAEVISVEHDAAWYEQMKGQMPSNVQLVLKVDPKEYASLIATNDAPFDVIVIDGRYRTRCAKIAPRFLTDQGFLVLDNSDWYPRTALSLREEGFFQVDFNGFGPINDYTWTTSMFFRAPIGLQARFKPASPIGGIVNDGDSAD